MHTYGQFVLVLLLLVALALQVGARRLPSIESLDKKLVEAARRGDYEAAAAAIRQGAHLDARAGSWQGPDFTALHLAANNGFLDIVRHLVALGADIDARNGDLHTPIMQAAFEGHDEVVQFLAAQGANLTVTCIHGETTLHEAAQMGQHDVVSTLLKYGHQVDPLDTRHHGATPLMWAARWGHPESVVKLLDAGADATIATSEGKTALHWAGTEIHPDAVDRQERLDKVVQLLTSKGGLATSSL